MSAEEDYRRKQTNRIRSISANKAQAPTTNDDALELFALSKLSREELVDRKITAQAMAAKLRSMLRTKVPFEKYQRLEARRQKAARTAVMVDRELARRKARERDALEKARANKPKSPDVDWPREFLAVAKLMLDPERFANIERATEDRVARLTSADTGLAQGNE